MSDDQLIDAIEDYRKWQNETLSKGADTSPQAFIAARRAAEALVKLSEAGEALGLAIGRLVNMLRNDRALDEQERAEVAAVVDILQRVEVSP